MKKVFLLELQIHFETTGPEIWEDTLGSVDNIVEILTEVIHEVCGLKWSASGQQLASGGNDNLIHIWDRSTALSGLCSVVEQE